MKSVRFIVLALLAGVAGGAVAEILQAQVNFSVA